MACPIITQDMVCGASARNAADIVVACFVFQSDARISRWLCAFFDTYITDSVESGSLLVWLRPRNQHCNSSFVGWQMERSAQISLVNSTCNANGIDAAFVGYSARHIPNRRMHECRQQMCCAVTLPIGKSSE